MQASGVVVGTTVKITPALTAMSSKIPAGTDAGIGSCTTPSRQQSEAACARGNQGEDPARQAQMVGPGTWTLPQQSPLLPHVRMASSNANPEDEEHNGSQAGDDQPNNTHACNVWTSQAYVLQASTMHASDLTNHQTLSIICNACSHACMCAF